MISYYPKLSLSSTSKQSYSLLDCFDLIKNNKLSKEIESARISGKKNKDKPYVIWQYGENVNVNYYDHVKNKTGAISWSINLKGKKRKKAELTSENLTSYIYFDIDETNLPIEVLENRIKNEAYIVANWRSFGGKGLGFLIKVKDLTLNNYLSTWSYYKNVIEEKLCEDDHNGQKAVVIFDVATKDFTRLNSISYDPNLHYNKYAYEIPSKEPIKINKKVKFDLNDKNLNNKDKTALLYAFNKWYKDSNSFTSTHGGGTRLNYNFYKQYFSHCNILGIEREDSLEFLMEKSNENDYNILFQYRDFSTVEGWCNNLYDSYNGQFGTYYENAFNDITGDIIEINIPFKGTIKRINDFITYSFNEFSIKKINYQNIKKITIFFKEKGIKREFLIEFLLKQNYTINENILNVLHAVYDQPYFLFGVIVKEDKKKNINKQYELILLKESKGFTTYKNRVNRVNKNLIPTKTTSNVSWLKNYFINCIKNSVEKKDSIAFILDHIDRDVEYETLLNYADFCYIDYEFFKGLFFERKAIKNKIISNKIYTLKNDEYLGDLNLELEDNTILWADTGTGKTTFVCSKLKGKQIVLVPVIPILESIENSHKASVFYGKKKNVDKLSDLIICTYSSFPTLFSKMISEGYDTKEYGINIDEWQHFIISSSKQFREKELNFILDKLSFFKKRTMHTGTFIENIIPEFQNYNIVRVKKSRTKNFTNILYQDKIVACESLCDKKGMNIIYLQSKQLDKELGTFKNYFIEKGWKESEMIFLNNEYKDKPYFETLLKKELIDAKYKIVFCTSLVAEGLNINNSDISTLHFCTKESVHLMEQIVNRFRKTVPVHIYTYEKYQDNVTETFFNGLLNHQKSLVSLTEHILKITYSTVNKGLIETLNENTFAHKVKGNYKVNYLTIAHDSYIKELEYSNKDKNYMAKSLKEYSWVFKGNLIIESSIDDTIKRKLKTLRTVEKTKIFNEQINIFNESIKEDIETLKKSVKEENVHLIAIKSSLPDFEYQLRKNIVYLSRYLDIDDINKIILEWQENNFSNIWYSRFSHKLRIKKQESELFFNDRVNYNSPFSKDLKNRYFKWVKLNTKPKFLKSGLIKLINDIKSKHNLTLINTYEEARSILDQYFIINQVLDEKKNIRYEIGSVNGIGEEIEHYHKLKALASSMLNGEITNQITKSDILRYVAHFRSKLPASSYIDKINPMSDSFAFKIFNYYCDIQLIGRGVYEIIDVDNELLVNFKDKKIMKVS